MYILVNRLRWNAKHSTNVINQTNKKTAYKKKYTKTHAWFILNSLKTNILTPIFRVFLPSWKFFDIVPDAAALWHRTSTDGTHFTEWEITLPKSGPRKWSGLFFNAQENFLIAAHALLEYFKNDLDSQSSSEVSYELVSHLVRYQIQELSVQPTILSFQFKVTSSSIEYTSPILPFHKPGDHP